MATLIAKCAIRSLTPRSSGPAPPAAEREGR